MNYKYLFGLGLAVIACESPKEVKDTKEVSMEYIKTEKRDSSSTHFGIKVSDPYRWLEDDRSAETEAWVKAENETTFAYLDKIPYRGQLKDRLSKLWNYERVGTPFTRGAFKYFYKNDGLQNHAVLYRSKDGGTPEVFLDPNTFSEDGTTSLAGVSFSKDGSKVSYQVSEGGSDWRKVIIMDALSKKIIEDTLVDVKFSGTSWRGNDGFYYSSYEKPKGSELSAKTDQHKLYFHQLGAKQSDDKVVFGDKLKRRYVGGYVTEDDRYLVISAATSTSGNELYVKDLKTNGPIEVIQGNFDSDTNVLDSKDGYLYMATNFKAPNMRVVRVRADKRTPEHWEDVIPETKNVLSPSTGAGYIFAEYMVDAVSKVYQYDHSGKQIRAIALPGVGTASGFSGKVDAKEIYFSFTNYISPGTSYTMDPKTGEYKEYYRSKIDFNADNFESKQVFYTSKDGTKVPMIITHKKGIKLDGTNPTILYGYGGFNISLQPSFSVANVVWLEQGGVYAVANLRGGGEYGKAWHDAGTQMKKQNVFDDFIAAGEYLIAQKYTSSDYLAVRGGSNGGLLVGATMTQRPDLMKVALPAVGVLDMLRYHTFTAGAGWSYDYGTANDSKEMFDYLLGYSPVHNVKKGVSYPATMVTTGDHDDRVVPAHSFKFAAELQEKQAGPNPVLIRIAVDAGHGAGKSIEMTIQEYADIFGFTLYNMGVKELK